MFWVSGLGLDGCLIKVFVPSFSFNHFFVRACHWFLVFGLHVKLLDFCVYLFRISFAVSWTLVAFALTYGFGWDCEWMNHCFDIADLVFKRLGQYFITKTTRGFQP